MERPNLRLVWLEGDDGVFTALLPGAALKDDGSASWRGASWRWRKWP